MRSLPLFLMVSSLALTACGTPSSRAYAGFRKEYPDLLDSRFEVLMKGTRPTEDMRQILAVLHRTKITRNNFDTVNAIEFETPTRAYSSITWSGEFHGGEFTLEKRNGEWSIVDEKFFF